MVFATTTRPWLLQYSCMVSQSQLYCRIMELTPGNASDPSIRQQGIDKIRSAAMKCFAAKGVTAASLREVAQEADVSVGLVQHYFASKADLIAAVDAQVLTVFGEIIDATRSDGPEPEASKLGGVVAQLVYENPTMTQYIARALIEGGQVGTTIFTGLLEISAVQRDLFGARDMTRADLDPLWGALHPLILRFAPFILRAHVERHLPGPFQTLTELQRWDSEVTALIRTGQDKRTAT